MKAIVKAALAVAKKYPVFSTQDKIPCWANADFDPPLKKGEGGYKIATQDPDEVKRLFSHPRATEIAVPMGAMSGLLCVDVDLYKADLNVWLDENYEHLDGTLCHETRSGGRHFIFLHPGDNIRFPSTLREGVDLKAGGNGYICWPGTKGYKAVNKKRPKPFPMELLKAAMLAKGGSGNLTFDSFNSATDEQLIERIQAATELYPSLRSLAYRMPGRRADDGTYLTEAEMVNILENLMDTSVAADADHDRHEDWADRRRKISDLVSTAADKEKGGVGLTDPELAALQQGESLIKVQEMIAASTRPIGPQREIKLKDIEKRVAEMETADTSSDSDTRSSSDFVRLTVGQLNEAVLPPIEWVLPDMIPEMSTVSLAGMSNVGKTRFLAALVVGLAVGDTKRMGLPQCTEKITTVWVANEERTEDICRRLKAVALQHGDKDSAVISVRGKAAGMLRLVALNEAGNLEIDEKNVALIVAEIRAAKAKLVIFDPYVTISDAADENSSASASMITKAFLLITSATGCALVHAHHCPKDRGKDLDWVRGDASAWRGSGGIYSALDCGFTLSNWFPKNAEQRKAWKQQYLSAKLSRFIVLDTGKIREGEPLDPVMMELVPQEMTEGEGRAIGVCKIITEADAANALLDASIDVTGNTLLAIAMVNTLGEGTHSNMTKANRLMGGHELWPNTSKTEGKDALLRMFGDKFNTENGSVQMLRDGKGNWRIVIEEHE